MRKLSLLASFVLTLTSMFPTFPARAGSVQGVNIQQIQVLVSNSNAVIVVVTGAATGSPACATYTSRFAIDLTTPAGQAAFAMAMTLKAQGAKVAIQGGNDCGVWGDTETVYAISTD